MKNKIVLITSGQPSLNPRLVKEADALAAEGYDVTVIYQYWNAWGTELDEPLFKGKKWRTVRVGGNPQNEKISWYLSRIRHKLASMAFRAIGFKGFLPELASGRCTAQLMRKAATIPASLYIAHNLPAVVAAQHAARKNGVKYAFDAEDFHRHESHDDPAHPDVKRKAYLEEKYLPGAAYITAGSPMIAMEYEQLLKRPVTPILNVFDRQPGPPPEQTERPLRILWFSQTIGPNRGIETAIRALSNMRDTSATLHVLGFLQPDFAERMNVLIPEQIRHRIQFYKPLSQTELFAFVSTFDIGLASESGFCINNNIALSNKLFTYIQCGLAVLASNTPAQEAFLKQHPGAGKCYLKEDAQSLRNALDFYAQNRQALHQARQHNFALGQTELNWENESRKFLQIVKDVVAE